MALRGTESLHQPAPHLTYSHNHWEGMGLVGWFGMMMMISGVGWGGFLLCFILAFFFFHG